MAKRTLPLAEVYRELHFEENIAPVATGVVGHILRVDGSAAHGAVAKLAHAGYMVPHALCPPRSWGGGLLIPSLALLAPSQAWSGFY